MPQRTFTSFSFSGDILDLLILLVFSKKIRLPVNKRSILVQCMLNVIVRFTSISL